MRLYLSSFRVGDHGARLVELARGGRRVALVPNALDGLPDLDRRAAGLARDTAELTALGFEVGVVDLADADAARRLAASDVVWVRGGNSFVLRRVLADTGTGTVLLELLAGDAIVYGGYSAGGCVLGTSLRGLDRVDDPRAVADPLWTGLGLLDRPFVPHVDSPDHPESADCDAVSAGFTATGVVHWALRDGEVLLVDGGEPERLGRTRP